MLNSTVDTDLVGELVTMCHRTWHDNLVQRSVIARGRVRAVTTTDKGYLRLWLHLEDASCVESSGIYFSSPPQHMLVSMVADDQTDVVIVRAEKP